MSSTTPTALAHVSPGGEAGLEPAAALLSRIVRVLLRPAPFEALTVEILPEVLDAFGARAGALLLYRRQEARLGLSAARGLSAEGAALLETVGEEDAWTMPLRALLDRRVYLIEAPHADPWVPEMIVRHGEMPVANLAAVPLTRWHLPLGVLLMIAGDHRIAEDELIAHALVWDVLALALSADLGRERLVVDLPSDAVAPPLLACASWIDPRSHAPAESSHLTLVPPVVEHERDVIQTLLHELQTAVGALESERLAMAAERAAFGERLSAAERDRLEMTTRLRTLEQVVVETAEHARAAATTAERERERARAAAEAVAAAPWRDGDPAASQAPATDDAPASAAPVDGVSDEGAAPASGGFGDLAPDADGAPLPADGEALVSPAADTPVAAPPAADVTPPAAASAPRAPCVDVASAPGADVPPGTYRLLEPDPALAERLDAAITAAVPVAPRTGLVVANLRGAPPEVLRELAAVGGSTPPIAYAADVAGGRSRVLGAVRPLVDAPSAADAPALLAGPARGMRRVITISSDVDTFMPAKTGLAKSGNSVSMACDYKQALDLLAILRPDAVFVDLRHEAESAAAFLDALLAPEHPRVLMVLLHGDPTGVVLGNVVERMLRPLPLDPSDLARKCRSWTSEPPPATKPIR